MRTKKRVVFKGRYIRRTKRGRINRKRTNKRRHYKIARSRFHKQIMPVRRGPYSKANELHWVQLSGTDPTIPYFRGALPTKYYTGFIDVCNPNNYLIDAGVKETQTIGRKINLINIDVTFKIEIDYRVNAAGNNSNFPTTNAEYLDFFRGYQASTLTYRNTTSSLTPKIRICCLVDKKGKSSLGDFPGVIGYPNPDYGFQAPWDHHYWKVLEDKIYSLKVPITLSGINIQSTVPKMSIYIKKSFPLRMTAELAPLDAETYRVNTMKNMYLMVATDSPWDKAVDGQFIPLVKITEVEGRLWFKDP